MTEQGQWQGALHVANHLSKEVDVAAGRDWYRNVEETANVVRGLTGSDAAANLVGLAAFGLAALKAINDTGRLRVHDAADGA